MLSVELTYHQFLETLPDAAIVVDGAGQIVLANTAAEALLGCPPGALAGQPARAYWPDVDWTRPPADPEPAPLAGRPEGGAARVTLRRKPLELDGRRLTIATLHAYAADPPAAALTASQRAEAARRDSEANYRQLFEHMSEGFALQRVITDAAGQVVDFRIVDANPAYERHTGRPPAEVIGHTMLELYPETTPAMIERYGQVALGGEPWTREYYSAVYRRDLRVRVFSPQPGYFASIFEDVTEWKQAETALRESETRLRAVLDNSYDAIGVHIDGVWEMCNPAAVKMFGVPGPAALLGRPLLEVIAPAEQERIRGFVRARTAGGAAPLEYVTRGRRADGAEFDMEVSLTDFELAGRHYVLVVLRDITARRRTEAAEREQRRLAEALRDTAQALTSSLDTDELLDRILANVGRVVPSDASGILLVEGDQARVARTAVRRESGAVAAAVGQAWTLADWPGLRAMYETRQPVCFSDTATDPRWRHAPADDWDRSYLGAPIRARDAVIGFISLHATTPGFYQPHQAADLLAFADQAASALENARLLAETRRRLGELEQSESRFARIFAGSPIPMTLSRLADGIYLAANDAFLRLSGFTEAEVIGQTALALAVYPEPARRSTLMDKFRRQGRVESEEQLFRTKSGGVVSTRLWLEPITIHDEPCLLAVALDRTEQRQAEAKLRQLSRAVEQSPATIVITDTTGQIQYANPKFTQTTGYSLEEALGQNPRLLKSGETSPEAYRRMWATIASGGEWRGEFHNRKKNGELYWESATLSPIFDAAGRLTNYLAVKEDITERKAAEAALRASEQRYRSLFDSSPLAVWEEDLSAVKQRLAALAPAAAGDLAEHPEQVAECARLIHVTDANSTALRLLGAGSLAEFQGALVNAVLSETNTAFERELRQLAGGQTAFQSEGQYQILTGERLFLSLHGSALPGYEATLARVIVTAIDFTARERADEALAEERNLLRTLIDQLPHAIYVKDRAGRFVIKNRADARKMGAASPEATIGKTDFDFYPAALAAQYHADDQAVIATGQAIVNREEPITEADGRQGWVSTTKVPLRDRQGRVTGLVGIGYDITETKRVEEEIKHRLAELEAVNRVSTALRAAQRLDEMLPRLLAEAVAIVGGRTGGIWLHDPEIDELWLATELDWGRSEQRFKRGEGVPGHVLATGQPYRSRDLQNDPRIPEANRGRIAAGTTGICVPIRAADEISGVLYVTAERPREFTSTDVHLLTTLAEIAGNAIHRMRLHEQTERRLRQLTALRAIDIAISSSLDLSITLSVLVDQALAQLEVDAVDVLLLEAPTQRLVSAAGRGFRAASVGRPSLAPGQGYAGRMVFDRRPVAVPEGAEAAPHAALLPAGEGFRAYYGVPLIGNGRVAGVFEVYHRAPLHPDQDWLEFLEALAGQAAIAIDNARLMDGLQHSNFDLSQAYEATIEGWSRALDLRDKETEGHSQRVTSLTLQLAVALGMQAEQLVHVRRGALLHDIGKMGVPDRILLKPGPLTDDEWVLMRLHPKFAYDMLAPIDYLRAALDIPYGHHEKWDGTGYPQRLAGEAIPLAARIFAVVDVWDALRSDRPYRPAWPADRVREYIQSMAGTHFDPRVVKVALETVLMDSQPD